MTISAVPSVLRNYDEERKAKVYLGTPCVHGHRGYRYVACRTCVDCSRKNPFTFAPQDMFCEANLAAPAKMVISPWETDEFGNQSRTVTGT